jgi:hypothetical protein
MSGTSARGPKAHLRVAAAALVTASLLAVPSAGRSEEKGPSAGPSWTLDFEVKEYPLASASSSTGLEMGGVGRVHVRLHGTERGASRASGEVSFECVDATLGGGSMRIPGAAGPGLAVPKIRLGAVKGRLLVKDGVGTFEPVGVKSPDLEAKLSGSVQLRDDLERSLYRLELRFRLSDDLKKRQPATALLATLLERVARGEQQQDGFSRVRLSGTLSPRRSPLVLGDTRGSGPAPAGSTGPTEGGPPAAASTSAPVPKDLVRALRPGRYELRRTVLDQTLADTTSLARQARFVPYFKDGQPAGFKLFAIRPGSFYAALGFRNGDALLTLNGIPLTSPDRALEAYTSLRGAREVVVTLDRRGEPVTLTYVLR